MKISLKQIYIFFFLLGIFFIPFNSYQGISFLGEYSKDGAVVFFLLSFFFFLIDAAIKKVISIPYRNLFFQFLTLLLLWLILSTLLNIPSVLENYIKQTSGINRFIRQLFSLSIALFLFIMMYNIAIKFSTEKIFLLVRKTLLYSFIFVAFYGFIEILFLVFHFNSLKGFIEIFDYFPFLESNLDMKHGRISSVSYEPPFLAIYLITTAGWMFSYIITSKSVLRYLPTFVVIILTFFSGSRTALIVVLLQFVVFLSVLFSLQKKYREILKKLLLVLSAIALVLLMFNGKSVINSIDKKVESLNFKKNLTENVSNRTRFGIQYTSLLIFIENPIIGVGFGQQSFHARDKYPEWATNKNYEFELWYLNDSIKSFPPGYNMYTRLLAETGIIGFFIFVLFLILLVYQSKKLIKHQDGIKKTLSIVLLVSFIGFIINWMQIDSFRIYGFWICLALLISQLQQRQLYE